MSWLFAVSESRDRSPQVTSYHHDTPLCTASLPGFYLAAGGNPDTCFCENDPQTSTGWAVVGIGMQTADSRTSILTRADWAQRLARESFDPTSLDGHFVVLRWRQGEFECFTDQLGLRTLYFASHHRGVCLSTRLDWLTRTIGRGELDFPSLGGRWLMVNQFSYDSGLVGINRLGPGGHATFKRPSTVSIRHTPWSPSLASGTSDAALETLRTLVQCALDHPRELSLGLSGGLDSRLLLALLTNGPTGRFVIHTSGDTDDPDVHVAGAMAKALGIPHHRFNDPLPEAEDCISTMRTFVAQTQLIEPGTSFLKVRYYRELRRHGRLMIDGGFGEFARRRYLSRLVRLGRGILRRRDVPRLFAMLRLQRADVFSPDVTLLLEQGARRSLEQVFADMPPVEQIGVENFADLLALRARVPNYGAPEQARHDGEVLNFMPLVQPSFLRAAFAIPVQHRRNAAFHYNAIRSLNPILATFPLVKSGFPYRFGLSTNLLWLVKMAKAPFAAGYTDPRPHLLLTLLRDHVLDLAHSAETRTNPIYDAVKVTDAVVRYYRGETRLRSTVDWWLTFELWRQSLQRDMPHRADHSGHETMV